MSIESYDPRCEDISVGMRAVLLLVRRGRKQHEECLEELGLSHVDVAMLGVMLEEYDGLPRTYEQLEQVVRVCPALRTAANKAVRMYVALTAPQRARKVFVQYA